LIGARDGAGGQGQLWMRRRDAPEGEHQLAAQPTRFMPPTAAVLQQILPKTAARIVFAR
jgi:hypothetical protein